MRFYRSFVALANHNDKVATVSRHTQSQITFSTALTVMSDLLAPAQRDQCDFLRQELIIEVG